MLSSIAHRTPPIAYGPWEQVSSTIAEGMAARGHEVTLFATADSITGARLAAVAPHGYEETPGLDVKVLESLHIASAFERASEFDLISNQFDFLPLTYSRLTRTPVVTTVHGFSSPAIVPVYEQYNDIAHYVAISDADRHPALSYAATIHHGIDVDSFTFGEGGGGYLLFLGRIHPDKGTRSAIEVARLAGVPLVIAGIIQDTEYFRDLVEPMIDGEAVRYLGPIGPAERDCVLRDAIALLHLIEFEEPFGLSVIEALAAGTPVIAHARGSMPELIDDGITGYLVTDIADAVAAVRSAPAIDRRACRATARERFGFQRMIDEYERLFATVVDR